MKLAILSLAALVGIAACTETAQTTITGTIPGPNGQTTTIVVQDSTRQVGGFIYVQRGPIAVPVENPDGDATRLRVSWSGGGCTSTTTVDLTISGDETRINLTAAPVCQEQMAAFRAIDLVMRVPTDADDVTVTFGAATSPP